jgi:hypothetical protein
MDETHIIGILFEPDWYAVYVEGERFTEGHDYDDTRMLTDAVNNSHEACHIETTHTHVDGPWSGTPDTLTELVEDDQFDVSESILEETRDE